MHDTSLKSSIKRAQTPTQDHPPDLYLRLVQEFPLRRIKSTAQHARAKRMILRCSVQPGDRGVADYVDVLADLVADFERRSGFAVDARLQPAELIRHRMSERGLSISTLSRAIGLSQSNLSEMLGGKRDWSKAAIRALSSYFNIRAERFLA